MFSKQPVPPSLHAAAFTCPHCSAYAQMDWDYLLSAPEHEDTTTLKTKTMGWQTATCGACEGQSVWKCTYTGGGTALPRTEGVLCWPSSLVGSPPADDMPLDALVDYEEARA